MLESDTIEQWHPKCNWTSYSAANMFEPVTFTPSYYPSIRRLAVCSLASWRIRGGDMFCSMNDESHTKRAQNSKPSSINHKQSAWHALLPLRFCSISTCAVSHSTACLCLFVSLLCGNTWLTTINRAGSFWIERTLSMAHQQQRTKQNKTKIGCELNEFVWICKARAKPKI